MAPLWRSQHWFSELARLLTAAPWPIPLIRDLLSQVKRTIWHPQPNLWALHLWPLDGSIQSSPRMCIVYETAFMPLSGLSSPSEQDQGLNRLCPVRALRIYIEHSTPFRQSEQLFVCFGCHTKGSPVTKQRLTRWIIDAIKLASILFFGPTMPHGSKSPLH